MKRLDESELSKPPSKVLEVLCKLGKGSYGSVFKAKHKASGTVVAVKKVLVIKAFIDSISPIPCGKCYSLNRFESY